MAKAKAKIGCAEELMAAHPGWGPLAVLGVLFMDSCVVWIGHVFPLWWLPIIGLPIWSLIRGHRRWAAWWFFAMLPAAGWIVPILVWFGLLKPPMEAPVPEQDTTGEVAGQEVAGQGDDDDDTWFASVPPAEEDGRLGPVPPAEEGGRLGPVPPGFQSPWLPPATPADENRRTPPTFRPF